MRRRIEREQTGKEFTELTETVVSKTCPRCRGYVYTNRDMYGEYEECLQCGFMVDVRKSDDRVETLTVPPKEVA